MSFFSNTLKELFNSCNDDPRYNNDRWHKDLSGVPKRLAALGILSTVMTWGDKDDQRVPTAYGVAQLLVHDKTLEKMEKEMLVSTLIAGVIHLPGPSYKKNCGRCAGILKGVLAAAPADVTNMLEDAVMTEAKAQRRLFTPIAPDFIAWINEQKTTKITPPEKSTRDALAKFSTRW